MADCVYGLRRDEQLFAGGEGPEEMEVVCVKPRNVHPQPLPFRLALSRRPGPGEALEEDQTTISYIDSTGSLNYIGNAGVKDAVIAKAVALVKENPDIAFNTLVKETKVNRGVLKDLLASRGYTQKPYFVNGRKKFRWSNNIITMQPPTADSLAVAGSALGTAWAAATVARNTVSFAKDAGTPAEEAQPAAQASEPTAAQAEASQATTQKPKPRKKAKAKAVAVDVEPVRVCEPTVEAF
jgi:hypothetical protein